MTTRYFAHYNIKSGRLIGIYDNVTSQYIPTPSVEITQEENIVAQRELQKGLEAYVIADRLEYRSIFSEDLTSAKASKLKEVNLKADYALFYLIEDYPNTEMSSWYKQEMEAKFYKMDPVNYPSILIENIAAARGMTADDLVDKIILKSNIFSKISGMVFGRRQKYEDDLRNVVTISDVEAIVVDFSDIIDLITGNKGKILS